VDVLVIVTDWADALAVTDSTDVHAGRTAATATGKMLHIKSFVMRA
jgi:hypothetical protein